MIFCNTTVTTTCTNTTQLLLVLFVLAGLLIGVTGYAMATMENLGGIADIIGQVPSQQHKSIEAVTDLR